MTIEEARQFLIGLFSFYKKPTPVISVADHLKKYYLPDIVCHYKNLTHSFSDVAKRIELISNYARKFHLAIEDLAVFDNTIVAITRQSMNFEDDSHYEVTITLVYRLRKGKAYEMWFMADSDIESYTLFNQNFKEKIKNFGITKKNQTEFLKRLSTSQYFHQGKWMDLSDTEKKCLYYYLNGFSSKETAKAMELSYRTIESYLAIIKEKYGCSTKAELRKKLFPQEKA